MEGTDWITWESAATLTGLPVRRIEYAVRVGRIRRRRQHGRTPTLDAASVQEWASWYRDVQERLKATRRGARLPRTPLPSGEWISIQDAAELLGVSAATTKSLRDLGHLEGHRFGQQVWFSADAVRELAAERAQWITWTAAAELLGCRRSAIPKLVERGHLEQRVAPTAWPSIRRASVVAYIEPHRRELATAAQRQAALEKKQQEISSGPQDGEVWLNVPIAALVLGMSASGVLAQVHAGRLPATQLGRRWWLRRGDVERSAAARAFLEQMDSL